MTWTAERRAKQSESIQRWRPWEKSTGARTAEGKAKISNNAVKAGKNLEIKELFKAINELLNKQKHLLG